MNTIIKIDKEIIGIARGLVAITSWADPAKEATSRTQNSGNLQQAYVQPESCMTHAAAPRGSCWSKASPPGRGEPSKGNEQGGGLLGTARTGW